MTALAHLPADQQAVLDLVLRRGRSYAGIAGALGIDVDAVRARARDAVGGLGPAGRLVPPQRRAQVTDWLLGQADPHAAADVRDYLASSLLGRAFARSAAQQLGPIAPDRLPDIPATPRTALPPAAGLAAVAAPAVAILAAAIAIGAGEAPRPAAPAPAAQPSGWLEPTRPGSKADGATEILDRGGRKAIVVTAGGLPRSTDNAAYTVWLTTGGRDEATYVGTLRTDDQGRIDGLTPLQVNPSRYSAVLVTRQRVARDPELPGMVVLRGSLR
jgi:hypothetical protein